MTQKTKYDIVTTLTKQTGLPSRQVRYIVQGAIDEIIHGVERDGRIELRGLGVFEIRQRVGGKRRNPATGKRVIVKPYKTVCFRPGKAFKERVR